MATEKNVEKTDLTQESLDSASTAQPKQTPLAGPASQPKTGKKKSGKSKGSSRARMPRLTREIWDDGVRMPNRDEDNWYEAEAQLRDEVDND